MAIIYSSDRNKSSGVGTGGVVKLPYGETITANQLVKLNASGKVVGLSSTTTGTGTTVASFTGDVAISGDSVYKNWTVILDDKLTIINVYTKVATNPLATFYYKIGKLNADTIVWGTEQTLTFSSGAIYPIGLISCGTDRFSFYGTDIVASQSGISTITIRANIVKINSATLLPITSCLSGCGISGFTTASYYDARVCYLGNDRLALFAHVGAEIKVWVQTINTDTLAFSNFGSQVNFATDAVSPIQTTGSYIRNMDVVSARTDSCMVVYAGSTTMVAKALYISGTSATYAPGQVIVSGTGSLSNGVRLVALDTIGTYLFVGSWSSSFTFGFQKLYFPASNALSFSAMVYDTTTTLWTSINTTNNIELAKINDSMVVMNAIDYTGDFKIRFIDIRDNVLARTVYSPTGIVKRNAGAIGVFMQYLYADSNGRWGMIVPNGASDASAYPFIYKTFTMGNVTSYDAGNCMGIASESGVLNDEKYVYIGSSVYEGFTGLTVGATYYVNPLTGTITTTASNYPLGVALSSTKLSLSMVRNNFLVNNITANTVNDKLVGTTNTSNYILVDEGGSGRYSVYTNNTIRQTIDKTGNITYYGKMNIQGNISTAPSSATATGTAGDIIVTSSGDMYFCYATNAWKKITSATF